jgi:hypothetical protein
MGQPNIQVRANYIGQLPGGKPYYHTFIVVDDGKSKTYYRGGPESGGGFSDATRGTTGSGRSSGGSGYGQVVAESGPFVPNSIDYNNGQSVLIYQANLNPADVARVKASLQSDVNAVNSANVQYWPTGPNSNSFVGGSMRRLGYNVTSPESMWIPGLDQNVASLQGGADIASSQIGANGLDHANVRYSSNDNSLNSNINEGYGKVITGYSPYVKSLNDNIQTLQSINGGTNGENDNPAAEQVKKLAEELRAINAGETGNKSIESQEQSKPPVKVPEGIGGR